MKLIITVGSKTYSSKLNAYFAKDNRFELRHISEEVHLGQSKTTEQLYKEIFSVIDNEKLDLVSLVAFGRSSVLGSVENISAAIKKISNKFASLKIKVIAPPPQSALIFSNKLKTTLELRKYTKNTLVTKKVTDKNIYKIANMIDKDKFLIPAVLKATNLTGGAGISFINSSKKLISDYSKLKNNGIREFILTEYCVGPETSVELLCLGKQKFIYPMAIKEATSDSLAHADNKIKISGYVNNIPHLDKEVLALANRYKIQGYFSVEGIIDNSVKNEWKIMEGMTRFTGNHPMVNGSNTSFDSMEAIYKYICNKPCFVTKSVGFRMVIQLPIFKDKNEVNSEELLESLKTPKWILLKRVDRLADLPFSADNRVRIQITFIAGSEQQLNTRIEYLTERLRDVSIKSRIKSYILYLNNRFPKMINKKFYVK